MASEDKEHNLLNIDDNEEVLFTLNEIIKCVLKCERLNQNISNCKLEELEILRTKNDEAADEVNSSTETEDEDETWTRTLPTTVSNGIFKCLQCGLRFNTSYLCGYHVGKAHGAEHTETTCPYDGTQCLTREELRAHMTEHETVTAPNVSSESVHQYQCKSCESYLATVDALVEHVAAEHKKVICAICMALCKNKAALRSHFARQHKGVDTRMLLTEKEKKDLVKCLFCDELVQKAGTRRRAHMMDKHKDKAKFSCPFCALLHFTRESCRTHVSICTRRVALRWNSNHYWTWVTNHLQLSDTNDHGRVASLIAIAKLPSRKRKEHEQFPSMGKLDVLRSGPTTHKTAEDTEKDEQRHLVKRAKTESYVLDDV